MARDTTSGDVATVGVADWLSLAATPTFATMALLTAVLGSGPMDIGMVTMYLLMSLFDSTHWLRMFSTRRRAYRGS